MQAGFSSPSKLIPASLAFAVNPSHATSQNILASNPFSCLCAAGGPVCFFTFDKLCNANVGAADYIALAKKFHTIALSGVPIFTASIRSQAYR